MRRLVCVGCNYTEDLNEPTGKIHTIQLVDLHEKYDLKSSPDPVIQEDLCDDCREKLRRDFFGEVDAKLLDMPLMKSIGA
jgi:hypothetical protein